MMVKSCMAELQMQLLIIFAGKQFVIKFIRVAIPMVQAWTQAEARGE